MLWIFVHTVCKMCNFVHKLRCDINSLCILVKQLQKSASHSCSMPRTIKNRLVGRQRPPVRPLVETNEVEQPSAARGSRPLVRPLPESSKAAMQPSGSAVRGQRPTARPQPESTEAAHPLGPAVRGQRPNILHEPKVVDQEDVVSHHEEEEDEGHQPMFKSFPIAGSSEQKHVAGSDRNHVAGTDRKQEPSVEVPR